MKFISLLCIILSVFIHARNISFSDAWQELVKNSDALKADKEKLKIANFKQDIARDLYWPDISINGSYSHLNKPMKLELDSQNSFKNIIGQIAKGAYGTSYQEALAKGLTPIQAQQAGLASSNNIIQSFALINKELDDYAKQDIFKSSIRATWAIYTGGRIEAAQIVANGGIKEAMAILNLSKMAKFEDLVKTYFGVVLTKEVLKTRIEVESALKKHYEYAQKLEAQGQIAKVEKLSANASYDKARVDRQKAKKNLEIATLALTKMLHLKHKAFPTTNLFTNNSLTDLDDFMKKTFISHPALSLLDGKKEQARGMIKASKGYYKPEVFLFGDYNLYESETLLGKMQPDWLVGVGFKYSLISSHGRKGKLQIAKSTNLQVNHIYSQTKRDLSVLVEKTYLQALQALEEYNSLKSSIDLAKETVKLREKLFSQGMATSLDVIDAELFLQNVKTQRLIAVYNYVLSLSQLLSISNQIERFSLLTRKNG